MNRTFDEGGTRTSRVKVEPLRCSLSLADMGEFDLHGLSHAAHDGEIGNRDYGRNQSDVTCNARVNRGKSHTYRHIRIVPSSNQVDCRAPRSGRDLAPPQDARCGEGHG